MYKVFNNNNDINSMKISKKIILIINKKKNFLTKSAYHANRR